jgi:hypothetical protein
VIPAMDQELHLMEAVLLREIPGSNLGLGTDYSDSGFCDFF